MELPKSKIVSIVSGASAMDDKAFMPNPLHIKIGDIVTWKNTDIETHTVTSGPSSVGNQKANEFDSGLIESGQSFEVQIRKCWTLSLFLYDSPIYEWRNYSRITIDYPYFLFFLQIFISVSF